MHIKFAHTSSTHYNVAGDENRLWKWNSPYLKYFSKLLNSKLNFHLEHPVYQTNFQAMTSLWHDESPSHFSTVNQQIVIIFSLPILIDRIFEKFLGPPFCKIHHHGPHFWKKENYSDTLSMYLTWPVGREGIKYLTPREGINFFPARRRRKGKKFFTFPRGEVFYTFPPNWSGKAFLHSSHTCNFTPNSYLTYGWSIP